MIDLKIQGHGRFEKIGNYSRVRRVGDHIYVAGTTAIEPSGDVHAPNDTYEQSRYILFERLPPLLEKVDAEMKHVVLTRAYLTDMSKAGELVKAHGEAFAEILPVMTGVQVILTRPVLMVELEFEAIVT